MQISGIGYNGMNSMSMAKMMEEMRKKMFEKLDQNSDESLEADELAELAEKSGQKVSDLLTQFDSDQDGTLSRTEADEMADAMEEARMADMQQRMFEKLDQNGDGSLSKTELADLAEKVGQKAEDLLNQYDTNDDDTLDATEAGQMTRELGPQGPPPPPPPKDASAATGESDSEGNTIQSLLDALRASDDEDTTQSLLEQFTQMLIQTYHVDQTETTTGAAVAVQA